MYNELENQKSELSEKNSSLSEQQKVHTEIAQQRETQIKEQLKEDKRIDGWNASAAESNAAFAIHLSSTIVSKKFSNNN